MATIKIVDVNDSIRGWYGDHWAAIVDTLDLPLRQDRFEVTFDDGRTVTLHAEATAAHVAAYINKHEART